MADAFLALADLLKVNNNNLADRNISDLLQDAPVLAALAGDTCPFTVHSYLKETAAPVVGFRSVNDGRENTKSTDTQVDVTLKILDASTTIDKALADAFKNGPEAYVAREAARMLKAAFFQAEKQYIYGTVAGAAAGFTGLADVLTFGGATVINATGSTANTGSSVFAIRTTSDLNDVVAVAGNNGNLSIDDTVVIRAPGATTGTYPAYYTPISAWMCLQIGGAYSVGRICNLTAQAGKTLTDALLAQLLATFPSSRPPTHWAMNRRSLFQLQAARTATNATGAPAPIPTEAFGIPIVPTDAIVSTEAILL